MTSVRLQLSSDNLSDAALQDRVRSLAYDIEKHSETSAVPDVGQTVMNAKGEPITLGLILVTFMTSGAAVAALNVLKSYLERDRSMAMTLENPDGTKIILTAANMGDVAALTDRILTDHTGG